MKKIIIAFCIGTALISCGNNSGNSTATGDTTNKKTEEPTPGTNGPDGSTLDTSKANMLTDTNGRAKDTAHNRSRDTSQQKDK